MGVGGGLIVVGTRGHMGHLVYGVEAVRRLSRRWKVKTLLASPMKAEITISPISNNFLFRHPHPAQQLHIPLIGHMFMALALSRLGFWTFSLAAETVVQIIVPPPKRIELSGIEMGFASAVEETRWTVTATWARPEQLAGIAVTGMAVVVAGCLCVDQIDKSIMTYTCPESSYSSALNTGSQRLRIWMFV